MRDRLTARETKEQEVGRWERSVEKWACWLGGEGLNSNRKQKHVQNWRIVFGGQFLNYKNSLTQPLIIPPSWAGSTNIKLPAMGRVDGWMLLGPLSWGVSLWPHQSGQTRQGPDSVTGAGWLVRWGAPVGIYSPAALTTTASGRWIISTQENARLLLRYLRFPIISKRRQLPWRMTKWRRNEHRAVTCRETDRTDSCSLPLKHLWIIQCWHLIPFTAFFRGIKNMLIHCLVERKLRRSIPLSIKCAAGAGSQLA